jgi:hypothetical protein
MNTFLVFLVALSSVLAVGVGSAAAGCSIDAPCCSASAGTPANPCDLQYDTCTCTFACGPQVNTCSCACNRGPRPAPVNPDRKIGLRVNSGVSLTGVAPKLGDLGTWIQAAFSWWIEVDATKANNLVALGNYTGTFEQVINQIATGSGTTARINAASSTITFE